MSVRFVILMVRAAELERTIQWYETYLGMETIKRTPTSATVGYPSKPDSAGVEFRVHDNPVATYSASDHDLYWKISLYLPHVRLAYRRLLSMGVPVSTPIQFKDIGYLAHTEDPTGYNIELIQHQFERNFSEEYAASLKDDRSPLGQQTGIGLLTLRATNAERSKDFYTKVLGMSLLSSQYVSDAFDLHFFADTIEKPPNADPWSVDNREWLWSRSFTSVELQVKHGIDRFKEIPNDQLGYRGFGVRVKAHIFDRLKEECGAGMDLRYGEEVVHITDPDGHSIIVFGPVR
ncbi:conserved hypothetical protein [Perkinsus marinus ATCC 50983]|uniref:VOC domain-containing protein n=1 Tax=Perkinsus marinus (strain ATCC 50983 / TXsc) TaxID=423536 RepID=C5LTV6_PERM5|nr:conserved hypothetical protein [Perkinsus marinus ATCC 50983]EEQ99754.1 conserved hypothetical protein [Perkinsus marinus ATCC 50983]|eukprot:XP_002767037.1 conserved hypothetical protein [Perkinsus marinus ATCC 50983]